MTINLITDPLERPLGRLPSQFSQSEAVQQLIEILSEELFELQQVFTDLLDQVDIESATGDWLDRLGLILNVIRDGATDEEYRVKLNLKIYFNSSTGASEYVIKALRYMTGGENIQITDTGIATLSAITDGIALDEATIAEVRKLLAATVTLDLKSSLGYDLFTTVDIDESDTETAYTNPDNATIEYYYFDDPNVGGWWQDYKELATADITVDTALVGGSTSVFINRNFIEFISTTTDTTDAAVGLTALIDAMSEVSATNVANVITVTATKFTLYQLTKNTTIDPPWISGNGGVMADVIERGFVPTDTNTGVLVADGLAP